MQNQETSVETLKHQENMFLGGMVLSMFCWGMSWASGKVLSGYGDASNIALFRFSVTFISLLLLLVLFRQKLAIVKKGMKDLLFASISISVYTWLFFKGLHAGKAGAGGVLVTTLNPIISYAIMLIFTRRKPNGRESLGLIIGLLAGAVLLNVWNEWEKIFAAGNLYFVLATFTWAILSIFTARSGRYGSPVTFSLWMFGLCSVIMLLITSYSESQVILSRADSYFWGNLIFSSTVTTALATTFYFVATSKFGAGKASSFIFLVPFSAALGSWLFLNEVPHTHTVIGGVLGIVAVYILNGKKASKGKPSAVHEGEAQGLKLKAEGSKLNA